MSYLYKTKSAAEMLLVITALKALGYVANGANNDTNSVMAQNWFDNYHQVTAWPEKKKFGGSGTGSYGGEPANSVGDFIDKVSSYVEPEKVVLNAEYTAEVTPKGIRVGCQTFSFEKLDELTKASAKIRR